ncbi:ribonuclease P protein component [Luteimonas aquatica]|uniref:ribonuclease P protein component n=1 Tax=Luteimonas aquatica TaxID=450364 RepID=UPI001F56F907|nr:ribonuclease P protein component [Luteimonas aquatica]
MTAGLPPQARVRARADFDRIFQQGRRTASPLFALHVCEDAQPARLGLAVSRKVDPHAVGRNRIKRVLRDTFRRVRAQLPPGGYVVVARPPAAKSDNPALRAALLQLLRRAGALPASPGGGTIPPAAPSADSPSRPASDPSDGPSLPA